MGGSAQCTEPIFRPPSGFNDSQADGQMFNYTFDTNNMYDGQWFCRGLGGTWRGFYGNPSCLPLPAGYITENEASTEQLAVQGSQAGSGNKFADTVNELGQVGCGSSVLSSDTGWGYSGTVWGAPIYQNGQPVADFRLQVYVPSDSGCHTSMNVILQRRRQLVCPQYYAARREPNGTLQCVIPTPGCIYCDSQRNLTLPFTIGNPVSPVNGAKYEARIDYQASGVGGLSFGHYYNSQGAFRMPGTGPSSPMLSDYWRFSYDRHLLPVSGNPQLMAVIQREDGTVESFDGSGKEILNRSGAADRLANVGGSWTLTLANNDVEQYDTSGNLTSITTRSGIVTSIAYGANGKMSQITDSFGRALTIGYDSNGRLSSVTLPDGSNTISYGYGAQGLTSVTYADGSVLAYQYEDPNNLWLLTGITDENNQRYATYAYSAQGLVNHEEHAGGADSYNFNAGSFSPNFLTSSITGYATDGLGTQRTYTFTNQGGVFKLISSSPYCDGCPNSNWATFDSKGNPQKSSDLLGNSTSYVYDQTRNLETSRSEGLNSSDQATANSRTTTTQWDPTFRLPRQVTVYKGSSATGTPVVTTAYSYDSYGNVLTKVVTDGATGASRTSTTTYYNSGLFAQVATIDGPRTDVADVTTYTYYDCTTGAQCGQVHTITDALGHTTSYDTYDANGLPLQITDPNGAVTLFTYDLRQRIKTRTVAGEQTRFDYYPNGLLQRITQPDGSYLTYIYDGAHRVQEVDDALGDRLVYTLDVMGDRTQEQRYDPSGTLVRTQFAIYNNLGQLWQQLTSAGTDSQATVYKYDNQGNQVLIQAPLGRSTQNLYDELNRLKQTTDPAGGNTNFAYDVLDNLTSVTDPRRLVTSYTFNGLGDLTKTVSPDTGTTQAQFDSAGNVHSRTDARGSTGTYSYDPLNRVSQIVYPDQTITYTYDQGTNGVGRLSSVTDNSGQTTFGYDARGRLLHQQSTISGVTLALGYTYQNAQLASLTTPSGQQVAYSYDASGRISGLSVNGSTLLSSVQYNSFGPPQSWTWGNGTQTTRAYDVDGRLNTIQSAGTSTYSFNDDSTIASRSDDVEADYSVVPGTTSFAVNPASNQWQSASGALARTYTYDQAGNTKGDGSETYTYNAAGRLISAAIGSTTTGFAVNALGQRVSKTSTTGTTLFAYDQQGHLMGEYTGAGLLIEETVWMGDIPVATLRPNAAGSVDIYYVHTDHLNAPRRVTRPNNNTVVWRWTSDPFGLGFVDQDPDGDGQAFVYNLRFPGQYYDAETGLNSNGFRDFDPAVGRYIQSDPIGLAGGSYSTYAYVGGNPLSRIDPDGLQIAIPWVEPLARPLPLPTTVDPAVPVPNVGADVSTPGDPNGCDPCKGLRDRLQEHEQKLRDYLNDPLHADLMSRGFIWMDMLFRNGENVESIIRGRIRELQKQITTFKRDYEECLRKHGAA